MGERDYAKSNRCRLVSRARFAVPCKAGVRLPADPVPASMDKKTYFTDNYHKLATDPMAYGCYQLQMVLVVYDEPARSFQQVLDDLPKNRYE